MYVVLVPMATVVAVVAGVAIAYAAIAIAMAIGFLVGLLGQLVGSALGFFAIKTKIPVADPVWATTAAVIYFFYYVIHAGIYQIQWNYLSFAMVEHLLIAAALQTLVVTVLVALAAQVIALTEILHPAAPLLYPLALITSLALNWLDIMPWKVVAVPTVIALTIYFIVTRPKYAPVVATDDSSARREAY